jgi:hypothetical protein
MPFLERRQRVQHQGDTGLHIEDAGPGQFITRDTTRHFGQRAQWIHRVVMAKQQYRFG